MKTYSKVLAVQMALYLLKSDIDKLTIGLEYVYSIHIDLVKISILCIVLMDQVGFEAILKEGHNVDKVLSHMGFKDPVLFKFEPSQNRDSILIRSGNTPILSLDFYSSCYQSDKVESAVELIKDRFKLFKRNSMWSFPWGLDRVNGYSGN